MSLLSDIKFLLKKHIKNPFIITVGAYLLWRYINKQKKKESFVESIRVIEDDDKYQIIHDKNLNKYILHKNNRVFTSDDVDSLKKMIR